MRMTAQKPPDSAHHELPTDRISPFGLPYRVWWALFAGCGLAANVFGEALFDDEVIVSILVVGISAVVIADFRRRAADAQARTGPVGLLLVPYLKGAFLGAVLLVVSMLTWFAVEILTRVSSEAAALWSARFAIALFLGSVVLLLARTPRRAFWNYVRLAVVGLLAACLVVAFGLFLFCTGPEDLSVYPSAAKSPYRLPWKPGIRRLCNQGNRAITSHRGSELYAYDFIMPIGTEVCAARGGIVTDVIDWHDGNGLLWPNNQIRIDHGDGSFGHYLHFRKHGARVQRGQRVARGDVICESGNVGNSALPHLHFEVSRHFRTIPITFADVPGDGIPRIFRRYTSASN
jgi:hypothetical protein